MTPIEVRCWIQTLMTDARYGWSAHPECLARALGWKSDLALKHRSAQWKTLQWDKDMFGTVVHRLKMILAGEVMPTAITREYPGGCNDKGIYGPVSYLDWVPVVADDLWRERIAAIAPISMRVTLGVNGVSVEHKRFSVNGSH